MRKDGVGGAPGRVDGAKAARLRGKEAVFGADAVSHVIEEEDVCACFFRNSLRRRVVSSDAEELVRRFGVKDPYFCQPE
jgi:hypothetical protein